MRQIEQNGMGAKRQSGIIIILSVLLLSVKLEGQTISDYFPDIHVLVSQDPSPGYFFVAAPNVYKKVNGSTYSYIMMFDNQGTILFFQRMPFPTLVYNLQNDSTLTYLSETTKFLYFLNEHMQVMDSITTQGYKLNVHDYAVSKNDHVFLIGYDSRHMNMNDIIPDGESDATVMEGVVQEFDENKNLLYTWKTAEHFNVMDGNQDSPYVLFNTSVIDYCHLNAIAIDSDTSFLISSRHMDEITKVNRRTGSIIWRLGGKNNMFTFINDSIGFSHQHSIRKLKNGNILLFDNGNLHSPPFSSAVEYAIDEKKMTATLVKRYRHFPDLFSVSMGSVVRLKNGNTLIDWGRIAPSITEFHPDNSIAAEFDFSQHSYSRQVFKYVWQPRVFEPSIDTLHFGMWNGSDTLTTHFVLHNKMSYTLSINGYVNHDPSFFLMDSLPLNIPGNGDLVLTVGFYPSTAQWGYRKDVMTIFSDDSIRRVGRQIWLYGLKEDRNPPVVTILPDTNDVPLNPEIIVNFSEPVRRKDDKDLDYLMVDSLIIFRENGPSGKRVAFHATVNTEKDIIRIVPEKQLKENQIYYISYRNVLEDYMDNPAPVKEAYFSTGTGTGIRMRPAQTVVRIFPNPAGESVFIETNIKGSWKVQLFSVTGTMIMEKEHIRSPGTGLTLDAVHPGLYFVVITTNKGRKTVKKVMVE